MSLDVLDVLTDGIRRTFARNGLTIAAAVYVLSAVDLLFLPLETNPDAGAAGSPVASPIVGDSIWLGAAVGAAAILLLGYVSIVAYRTFVTDETERIPERAIRDRPLWAYLNVVIGAIVFVLLVLVGSVLFLIPGLFLLVSLWFFDVAVAVEGDDFVTAFERSWGLTRGNRLQLFGLGVVVVLATAAVTSAFEIPQSIVGGVSGALIAQVGPALTTVFTYATSAIAYRQLTEAQQPDAEDTVATDGR